jgi:hypothetical protein
MPINNLTTATFSGTTTISVAGGNNLTLEKAGGGALNFTKSGTNSVLLEDDGGKVGMYNWSGSAWSLQATIGNSGIKFGGGASTLAYYEEGTWTPLFAGASGTCSHSTTFGRYTRIGNVVYCTVALRATGISGASTIQITGLPFSAGDASDTGQRATYAPRLGGHINGISEATGRFRVAGNYMDGVKGDTNTTYMTAAEFSSGGSAQLTGNFWYYI